MEPIFEPVRKVSLSDGKSVEVRELTIIPMMGLLRRLGSKASEIFAATKAGEDLNMTTVIEVVSGCEDVVEYLLKHSSGRTDYTASDGLEVLQVAIELNFREELKKKFIAVGTKAAGLLGIQATSQPGQQTP